jgi:hypothetical protein
LIRKWVREKRREEKRREEFGFNTEDTEIGGRGRGDFVGKKIGGPRHTTACEARA